MTRTPSGGGSRRSGSRGFSLLELLVAMSIFSTISVGVIALLSKVSAVTAMGTSKTETLDSLQTFIQEFERDLMSIRSLPSSDQGLPEVRLYSDVAQSDVNGDGRGDATIRRLFFVRGIPQETAGPVTRQAGVKISGAASTDQKNDVTEAAEGKLKATGGLAEILWTAVPAAEGDRAVMTLYRATRSPIGGAGSLLPVKPADDVRAAPAERGPLSLAEIQNVGAPLLSGVLYFGVEFQGRKSVSWDAKLAPPSGPLPVWDSTRGIMRPGGKKAGVLDGFYFGKAQTTESSSAADPTDDTFPRRLRVTLVVEEVSDNKSVGALQSDLSDSAGTIELVDAAFVPNIDTAERHVKIGDEWIRFEAVDGYRLTGCVRGVRGTTRAAHSVGAPVHHGRTVVREFAVPTYRDAYKDELPSIATR
ncbi:MAG: type II secretion system protein J [Planctomycetota bacterium]